MKIRLYQVILCCTIIMTGSFYSNSVIAGENQDTVAFSKYISKIPYPQLMPLYRTLIKIPFDKKEVKPASLYSYASMIVARLESFRNHRPAEYMDIPPEKWIEQFNLKLSREVLITHVQLLGKLYKDEEAFKYAELAENYLHYKVAQVNSIYALLLDQRGDQQRLKEVLLKSMYENEGTPEMVGILAKSYRAEHRPENEFSNYLQSLKKRSVSSADKQDSLKSGH